MVHVRGVLCGLLATLPLAAQEATEPATGPATALGVDFVSKYFFRGLLQTDAGAIVQPWGDATFGCWEGDGTLRSVEYTIGVWNSLHSGPTGSGADSEAVSPTAWYECDFYNGLALALGDATSVGVTYTVLTSPNQSFETQYLLDVTVAYDDAAHWDEFAGLAPYVTVSRELHGANDLGDSLGWYLELGIGPTFEFGDEEGTPWELTVPVTAGFSLADYYEDENGDDAFFGFLDVGLDAALPIGQPGRFGQWTLAASAHVLFLDGTTRALDGGDAIDFVGTLGCALRW